jgi:hypothetical protein
MRYSRQRRLKVEAYYESHLHNLVGNGVPFPRFHIREHSVHHRLFVLGLAGLVGHAGGEHGEMSSVIHRVRQRRFCGFMKIWCTCGWRRRFYDISRTVRLNKANVAAYYHLRSR